MSSVNDVNSFIAALVRDCHPELKKSIVLVNINKDFNTTEQYNFGAVGLYGKLHHSDIISFAARTGIRNIINIHSEIWKKHLVTAFLMQLRPNMFIKDPCKTINTIYFSPQAEIDRFLAEGEADFPSTYKVLDFTFGSSMEKSDLMEEILISLDSIPGAKRQKEEIMLIVDELFTNALYNAPTVSMGTGSISRKDSVSLKAEKKANIQITFDQESRNIYIGCVDLFGTLLPQQLVNKLNNTYKKGVESSITFGVGGAGIGVRLMYEKSDCMSICVQSEKKTCMMFSVPLTKKKGEFSGKNLHFLQS